MQRGDINQYHSEEAVDLAPDYVVCRKNRGKARRMSGHEGSEQQAADIAANTDHAGGKDEARRLVHINMPRCNLKAEGWMR